MGNFEVPRFAAGQTVLILGGDGFCGWPTALRFSSLGAQVVILDNGARRETDRNLGVASLTRIHSLQDRVEAWAAVEGSVIRTHNIDLAENYAGLLRVLLETRPDIIIHFAEQRSAPYSMRSSEGARYTVDNNVRATHNLLAALVETRLDPHLMHLGTIGVYGYATAGLQLPEGYLKVKAVGADGREVGKEILYPGQPDSLYHMTKMLDQHLFEFYARYHGIRITDLHQGVVWGTQTAETGRDLRLVNRFDHDAIYGTVTNRFILQALEGRPLTVYGSGSQTRGVIHIEDMLTCLTLAAATPTERGESVRILNQIAETSSINALAGRISRITGAEVLHIDNPRCEPEGNEFEVDRRTFHDLGFVAHRFDEILETEIAQLGDLLGLDGTGPRSSVA